MLGTRAATDRRGVEKARQSSARVDLRSVKVFAFGLLGALALASSAGACPLCSTETGAQLRALAFGPDFVRHLGGTLAPVPILIALVAGTGLLDRLTARKERADA